MLRPVLSYLAVAAALVFPAAGVAQVVPAGQIDTFQDGTTMSWTKGSLSNFPAANVATGGPAGAGDRYLDIVSNGGAGADSKLVVFNQQQWGGGKTYSPAIAGLSIDLNNFGATPLTIRVAFQAANGNEYSTAGFSLAPTSGWQPAVFSITDPNMTQVAGAAQPFSTALATGIQTMRILNAAAPSFNGDPIVAHLGMDNIKAFAAVPEPGMVLLTAGAGFFSLRTLRRVRCRVRGRRLRRESIFRV
jgi:hypothetical protein